MSDFMIEPEKWECPLCDHIAHSKMDIYTHFAIDHLQRAKLGRGIGTEGLCFCGIWCARFYEHCHWSHPKMSLTEIAHAVMLGINPKVVDKTTK